MQVSAERGVTAIELMVVMTIVALLAAIAIPGWQDFMLRQRQVMLANQLTTHLALARSTAIARGKPVAVSTQGEAWHSGWRVHLELHPNGNWDSDESVLAEHQGDAQTQVTGNGAMSQYVMFDADGRPKQSGGGFQAGSIELCVPSRQGVILLVMSATGRVRQEQKQSGCSR
jgi:type IV fimbrial biogenesis protein FimT